MRLKLLKQFPASQRKKGIAGSLSVATDSRNSIAYFFDDNEKCVAEMDRPELMWINPAGLMLRGFQPDGCDKIGTRKYKYQEWYCALIVGEL